MNTINQDPGATPIPNPNPTPDTHPHPNPILNPYPDPNSDLDPDPAPDLQPDPHPDSSSESSAYVHPGSETGAVSVFSYQETSGDYLSVVGEDVAPRGREERAHT